MLIFLLLTTLTHGSIAALRILRAALWNHEIYFNQECSLISIDIDLILTAFYVSRSSFSTGHRDRQNQRHTGDDDEGNKQDMHGTIQ